MRLRPSRSLPSTATWRSSRAAAAADSEHAACAAATAASCSRCRSCAACSWPAAPELLVIRSYILQQQRLQEANVALLLPCYGSHEAFMGVLPSWLKEFENEAYLYAPLSVLAAAAACARRSFWAMLSCCS